MATASSKAHCVACGKEKVVYKCGGCLQDFCFNHLADHRRILDKQLDELEDTRNLFRERLSEQKINPQQHSLLEQIEKWKNDSIKKIQQTAEETKQLLTKYTAGYIDKIEIELSKLSEQLKEIRQENDFDEMILHQFKQKLKALEEQLVKPSNISIQQESSSFINKISVVVSSASLCIPNTSHNAKWIQTGITVVGGNGQGNGLKQLTCPYGVYVHDDQTLYVVDGGNHRIVEWKNGATKGQVVAGGNGQGNRNDQLHGPTNVIVYKENDSLIISDYHNKRVVRWPRRNGTSGETIISNVSCWGLTMDDDGYLYVPDTVKHEVRRWKMGDTYGTLVAGGNGQGNRLNQLNTPNHTFVDQDHSVYVSDYGNHRVMKWMKGAKEGIVVAGNQGQGNNLTQLSYPYGIIVDQLGNVYVADSCNHRVMRWSKGVQQGSVIVGGNGPGMQANQFNYPFSLSFDRQNNLYVVDNKNHRVQKFKIE